MFKLGLCLLVLGTCSTFSFGASGESVEQRTGVDTDIVLYLHFDEGSGTIAYDSSGYKTNGTLVNMEGNGWTKGKFGNALQFNGKDDYVDCGGEAALAVSTAISVECWIKIGSSSAERWIETPKEVISQGGIVSKHNGSCGRGWLLTVGPSGEVIFAVGRGVDWWAFEVRTEGIVNDGVWHHIVAVDDGRNLTIYRDGRPRSVSVEPHSILSDRFPLNIGRRCYDPPAFYFEGIIDEVCIYNRALDKEEVAARYKRGGKGDD